MKVATSDKENYTSVSEHTRIEGDLTDVAKWSSKSTELKPDKEYHQTAVIGIMGSVWKSAGDTAGVMTAKNETMVYVAGIIMSYLDAWMTSETGGQDLKTTPAEDGAVADHVTNMSRVVGIGLPSISQVWCSGADAEDPGVTVSILKYLIQSVVCRIAPVELDSAYKTQTGRLKEDTTVGPRKVAANNHSNNAGKGKKTAMLAAPQGGASKNTGAAEVPKEVPNRDATADENGYSTGVPGTVTSVCQGSGWWNPDPVAEDTLPAIWETNRGQRLNNRETARAHWEDMSTDLRGNWRDKGVSKAGLTKNQARPPGPPRQLGAPCGTLGETYYIYLQKFGRSVADPYSLYPCRPSRRTDRIRLEGLQSRLLDIGLKTFVGIG